ncbi:MAG: arsenic resistance protein [Deltaproteobacteria bacterium]|nr:arsenic resistance protein [Deltaproteobacteria bacterium]
MRHLLAFLGFLKSRLHYILLVTIALGLANVFFLGGWNIPKPVLLGLVIFGVIYPVMINIRFEDVLGHFRRPRPLFCSMGLNFIVSPALAAAIGWLFLQNQPELHAALMLLALLPTSAMSAAWTAFSGAKLETALYLIPANLLFAAFVALPFLLPWLLGGRIAVEPWKITQNILLVFLTPLILGDLTRRLLVRWKGLETYQKNIKPHVGGFSALGVTILILLVMGQSRNAILLKDVDLLWQAALPVLLYYLALYPLAIGWAVFLARSGALPRDKALVIVYTSVTRHVNISLALVLATFPPAAIPKMVLLVVLAFLVQVPSMAFFAQHFGRRFIAGQGSKPPT